VFPLLCPHSVSVNILQKGDDDDNDDDDDDDDKIMAACCCRLKYNS
jgi:hypothetical protein